MSDSDDNKQIKLTVVSSDSKIAPVSFKVKLNFTK